MTEDEHMEQRDGMDEMNEISAHRRDGDEHTVFVGSKPFMKSS